MTEANRGKRVAKNTALLYLRMIIVMMVGLFTSRVILAKLGVEDYGIYNLVGGVVAMFGVLSSSLVAAISRYVTFELGRGDSKRLGEVFSSSLIVLAVFGFVLLVIIEVVGIWFLNMKLNIPQDRMAAANFVLQCAVVSFVANLVLTPFSALVVAHERMGIYAYLSLSDVVLKLLILYALQFFPYDHLEVYAFLLMFAGFITPLVNIIYCCKQFPESHFKFFFDKSLFKEMGAYSWWSLFGNLSWMANTQGVSILINIFFGVTLNAARGIAGQVDAAIQTFVSNFMMALNPQITKSYASGDLEYMHKLIYLGSRISFYMVLLFAIPICMEAHEILHLWLNTVPKYTEIFVQLTMLTSMVLVLCNPLTTAQAATGKLKSYSIAMSFLTLSNFPLTYIAFQLGMPPYVTYLLFFFTYFLLIFVKIWFVKDLISITFGDYISNVFFLILKVVFTAGFMPLFIRLIFPAGMFRFLLISIVSILSTTIFSYIFGLKDDEKKQVLSLIKGSILSKTQ